MSLVSCDVSFDIIQTKRFLTSRIDDVMRVNALTSISRLAFRYKWKMTASLLLCSIVWAISNFTLSITFGFFKWLKCSYFLWTTYCCSGAVNCEDIIWCISLQHSSKYCYFILMSIFIDLWILFACVIPDINVTILNFEVFFTFCRDIF